MTGKVILLVEDNPDDVELTLRAFNKNHLLNKVVVAQDGAEAWEYLSGGSELPQLVLLDLHLPKLSGLEVLRHIRADERSQYLPVVILTTSREEQDLMESYRLGANSYICKPVDFTQFSEAMRQLELYWLVLNLVPPPAKEIK